MFKSQEQSMSGEEQSKISRFWHPVYCELIPQEELLNWSERDLKRIKYLGDLTEEEWTDMLDNCERDGDGGPILAGKDLDEKGNPID